MDSRVNNQNDNQEVFKEEQFRTVFFENTGAQTSKNSSQDKDQRVRLEAGIKDESESISPTTKQIPVMSLNNGSQLHHQSRTSPHAQHVNVNVNVNVGHTHGSHSHKKRKAPKFIRKFRSRSLPIINYTKSSHLSSFPKVSPAVPPLPPINIQSLKEIDLHEILKNPQLRHDILFDPQLQFRPNLDGERGKRKKTIIDKYWNEIERECSQFFSPSQAQPSSPVSHNQNQSSTSSYLPASASSSSSSIISSASPSHNNTAPTSASSAQTSQTDSVKIARLPILFTSLRDILLSLLPYKDRASVTEIMDIDLLIQQLSHGSFDFVSLAEWLGEVFKSHCAPMRDQWVSDMIEKFRVAYYENSVSKLVQGLRMIFSILEAMKLDVANHQIRILRPVLTETAVDFEKDYFSQLIANKKIDITDSLNWFYKSYYKKIDKLTTFLHQGNNSRNADANVDNISDSIASDPFSEKSLQVSLMVAIIDLLSCRNMVTEFPSSLAFDHTRLVLLRADVRQLVCVQLCIVLYKQLLMNHAPASAYRTHSFMPSNINKVQEEILAIVTDDNGNVKWTRNVQSIALQLVKNVVTNPNNGVSSDLPQSMVDFANNWLVKQIQPVSDVYGLMEEKIFKELLAEVLSVIDKNNSLPANSSSTTQQTSEMTNIASRIATLVKFHWNVFGSYYSSHLTRNS
ncbi:Piso0_001563 [Millerozyma farinosa CBS 7064]|uniref:Piso0_001563 protein n=1 Tax=Pichia sorbitophila (strain ATCC MYA-4447 / BCRC 22081 / CBS 7064 / NBRC 10061 / NRRL Y-12695) TaxID=559304 RepID=G8YL47_PICSO|nr:Piso0_001563 [Millerozyma farinosa CBS 7064]